MATSTGTGIGLAGCQSSVARQHRRDEPKFSWKATAATGLATDATMTAIGAAIDLRLPQCQLIALPFRGEASFTKTGTCQLQLYRVGADWPTSFRVAVGGRYGKDQDVKLAATVCVADYQAKFDFTGEAIHDGSIFRSLEFPYVQQPHAKRRKPDKVNFNNVPLLVSIHLCVMRASLELLGWINIAKISIEAIA